MKNESQPPASGAAPRSRGRPRAFDRDEALGRARETFWRFGYEGASIADLTAAMGITAQSLYAAFRSKADLYREALAQYGRTVGRFTAQALEEEADTAAAFERVLADSAREFARAGRPAGCMVSIALLACSAGNEPVARHAAGLRQATLELFRKRIERGLETGDLDPGTDAVALARYLGAIIQGMSVQARDGATEEELMAVARMAAGELRRLRTRPAQASNRLA